MVTSRLRPSSLPADGGVPEAPFTPVFIGQERNEAEIRAALDDCLLTDGDLAGGPAWAGLADPLPEWPTPRRAMAERPTSGGAS